MKVTIITKEYPPNVYGGAGVHVKFLARELAKRMEVDVRCFGEQSEPDSSPAVKGYGAWERMWEGSEAKFNSVFGAFSVDLSIARDEMDADVIHTHTWYTALAGYMARTLYGKPFVATVHSLEPLRLWKEEQLGRSQRLSAWAEKLALESADRVIAVSENSREDILKHFNVKPERVAVIHNGIDLKLYRPVKTGETRKAFGIGDDYILFVGRVSRQKGIEHLIEAVRLLEPGVQCVCCTSAPDTREFEEEITAKIKRQPRIVWINSLLREEQYVELYSNARIFACPSVYEPFGIINLEAMACETPVVASAVGGILETVVDGETGLLVKPADPRALADAINRLLKNRRLAEKMGKNGRRRVEERFSWAGIAEKTEKLYKEIIRENNGDGGSYGY